MRLSRCDTKPEGRFILLVPELGAMLREARTVPGRVGRLTGREPSTRFMSAEAPAMLVAGASIGAAALTRHLDDPERDDGIWLRADPIDLTPDLSAVWLRSGARLAPDSAATADLISMFDDQGLKLAFANDQRGYLSLDEWPDCEFVPPWQLAGESMERVMPTGPDQKKWRRLINETQVILHHHRRQSPEARLPGSLWFWGPGRLPARDSVRPRVNTVQGRDPALLGIAAWLGLPADTESLEAGVAPGRLVEWSGDHSLSADDNLRQLDEIIRGAWRLLRVGRLRQFELAGFDRAWSFRPAHAWRLWP